MIAAALYDALTRIVVMPRTVGMDEARFLEVDCEEDYEGERVTVTNRAMVEETRAVTVRPWPEPIRSHAHVDTSDRVDQFGFHAGVWHNLTEQAEEIVVSRLAIDTITPNALAALSSAESRPITRALDQEETRAAVAAAGEDATAWVRLPYVNESFGGTDLQQPAIAIWEEIPTGGGLALIVPGTQDHFAPFDLTHPDRYWIGTDDLARPTGIAPLPPNTDVGDKVLLEDGAQYALYLRPRRWRWFVTVIAHYLYIDPFYEWPADEIFLAVFWDRPPFYPRRHDITYTRRPEQYNLYNFYGEPRSFDVGVDSAWHTSRAAARMATEILDQQWWFLCNAYVFIGNEAPDILIESDKPLPRECVLGIGRVDAASGAETRTWVVQHDDLHDLYPRQVIGQFLANWYVTEGD